MDEQHTQISTKAGWYKAMFEVPAQMSVLLLVPELARLKLAHL